MGVAPGEGLTKRGSVRAPSDEISADSTDRAATPWPSRGGGAPARVHARGHLRRQGARTMAVGSALLERTASAMMRSAASRSCQHPESANDVHALRTSPRVHDGNAWHHCARARDLEPPSILTLSKRLFHLGGIRRCDPKPGSQTAGHRRHGPGTRGDRSAVITTSRRNGSVWETLHDHAERVAHE